ncbi:hypothetical protein F5Y08DRAFT_319067 [Xylaria arbuscula]|nr:hypothetical protein F5Y08DRAFT_319067 [Xylaria arbuscula]
MESFRLSTDHATMVGLRSLPPPSTSPLKYRPLIVGLHGGSYDKQYFDATPATSASVMSKALVVPFISIDRPSYGGTTSVLPVPKGSDFNLETGRLLHNSILPSIWSDMGAVNGCNCIVLLCHSLGVMGGTVAAALHAQDKTPRYPLGGIILSGMGDRQSIQMQGRSAESDFDPMQYTTSPVEWKDSVMFKPGTVVPDVVQQTERLNAPMPLAESGRFAVDWLPIWKEIWAAQVLVPVMFSLVDDDPFFISTKEEVDRCVGAFTKSVRAEGSLVLGAPHCIELSYWSQGWYARCFGFAIECAASL